MVMLSEMLTISDNPSTPGNDMRHRRPFFIRPSEEQIQARTIIAENFPADYSPENLEKIFCYFGRVRSFRVRNPQDPNLAGCSRDVLTIREGWWSSERTMSGLHAIVEFETEEQANGAIAFFNSNPHQKDGLRVHSRREYSIASEQGTRSDMNSNLSDEGRNPKKGRERHSAIPTRMKLSRNQWTMPAQTWERRAGFRN